SASFSAFKRSSSAFNSSSDNSIAPTTDYPTIAPAGYTAGDGTSNQPPGGRRDSGRRRSTGRAEPKVSDHRSARARLESGSEVSMGEGDDAAAGEGRNAGDAARADETGGSGEDRHHPVHRGPLGQSLCGRY